MATRDPPCSLVPLEKAPHPTAARETCCTDHLPFYVYVYLFICFLTSNVLPRAISSWRGTKIIHDSLRRHYSLACRNSPISFVKSLQHLLFHHGIYFPYTLIYSKVQRLKNNHSQGLFFFQSSGVQKEKYFLYQIILLNGNPGKRFTWLDKIKIFG